MIDTVVCLSLVVAAALYAARATFAPSRPPPCGKVTTTTQPDVVVGASLARALARVQDIPRASRATLAREQPALRAQK